MLINPALPVVIPPETFWRASYGRDPWARPSSSAASHDDLVGYLEAAQAVAHLLQTTQSWTAHRQLDDALELHFAGSSGAYAPTFADRRLFRPMTASQARAVLVQAVSSVGVFFDVRDEGDVKDFRFHAEMDPEFRSFLSTDFPWGPGLTTRLRQKRTELWIHLRVKAEVF